ncbi:MAG TPA: radical SAM protein [Deinococcales bacterium]|nr:radical SAM protein [Deinococcales bacterium]
MSVSSPAVAWPLVNLAEAATVLSPRPGVVGSWDREGRLLTLVSDGLTFKRALDSSVKARWVENGERRRQDLTPEEGARVFEQARAVALDAQAALPPGREGREAQARLETEILPWTPERLAGEGPRFRAAYPHPIAILPPDSYADVVLQATHGCTWNKCTFCNFYQGTGFHALNPDEFTRHAERVQALLGRGANLRQGLFLADGNALALSYDRLEPILQTARAAFPNRPVRAFLDVLTGDRHAQPDWPRLAALGLDRVHIGLETGHDELLAFLNKPGSAESATRVVTALKAAGLSVTLIVMVGVGGREWQARHRAATLQVLTAMPLDARDLVYLSPFQEHGESRYTLERQQAGLTPMTGPEVETELKALTTELKRRGRRAARYDIREFIY